MATRQQDNTTSGAESAAKLLTDNSRRIFEGDRTLWIIFTVLLITSILVVYSSTAKMAYNISSKMTTTDALRDQIMFVVLSIPTIFIASKVDHKVFFRITPLFFLLFVGLTITTYFVGGTTNGAARWLPIGPIRFQPSEGLKIFTVMMLARSMESRQKTINKINLLPTSLRLRSDKQRKILRENTLPILGPVILACIVIAPAHTSSAMLIFIVSTIMLYIGRVKFSEVVKFVVVIGFIGAVGIASLAAIGIGRGDTAGNRLTTWVNEWIYGGKADTPYEMSDTQLAMVAIRNGGALGGGAGHSSARAVVIHPESDYAYSFFVSEYGLIMGLILMLLYLWIFFRSIEICRHCRRAFPALMTVGLGLLITCQALLHILVQVNFFPETGQNLPFISRGGSSLLFTTAALGMIISVSRTNKLEELKDERRKTR